MNPFTERCSPIGIDIGARTISAAQLSGREGAWKVEAVAAFSRTAGVPIESADAPPSVEELERLAEVLRRQGFRGNRVVLAAPESKVFSAVLELPPRSSGAPIEELAKQELARASRRDVGKVEVCSWEVPAPPRSAEATHLLAVGLGHEDAEAILDVFERARLRVEALDCRSWAMTRACRKALGDAEQVSSVLDLTDAAASLSVVHSGVVAYDRPIREAGLARLLDTVCKELRIEPEAAEYLLEALGSGNIDASLPEQTVRAGVQLLDEHMKMVVQELRSVMAYAMHRYPGPVGSVLLTGAGATNQGLRRKIREELELDARVMTPGDVGTIQPGMEGVAGNPALMTAMGLAMHTPVAAKAARRAA